MGLLDGLTTGDALRNLLLAAWLLPLLGFLVELYALRWTHRLSRKPAYVATACIALGFVFSVQAAVIWGNATHWQALVSEDHAGDARSSVHVHGETNGATVAGDVPTKQAVPADAVFAGTLYRLGQFGPLMITVDWYIDGLTLLMFVMVTFIATAIHVFAIGYLHDELTEDLEDHELQDADGDVLHRPGRFHRFFAFLSLFCFSMLGLLLAGNIFQVFVFWELVGLCSYLLIGFYVERPAANVAANKAFLMNRVGDFGFLIGLMIVWSTLGTFRFFDTVDVKGHEETGLFHLVRGVDGQFLFADTGNAIHLWDSQGEVLRDGEQPRELSYWLLTAAGLGILAGCIGKSAQFPLHTWLPDAMEGPTPVSALVHSATMVAAGIYLAGRFAPMFTPEVLLTAAYIGCITLFIGATIAIVATDIKRVLAYSTISQLGYMLLGIGVGGWSAGLFHLVTHACFKSLLFLCAGSVITGCHHVQDLKLMGGLRRKLPVTAFLMLVGVFAITGLAIPGVTILGERIALSGYHSKDAILAAALAFYRANPGHPLLWFIPVITPGLTAFYMFRMWFLAFSGMPRDLAVYDHARENSPLMLGPLAVLAALASGVGLGGESGPLYHWIAFGQPAGIAGLNSATPALVLAFPTSDAMHAAHAWAGQVALMAAFAGAALAYLFYGVRVLDSTEFRLRFPRVYGFLQSKWRFDELYDSMFVEPMHRLARFCAFVDQKGIDAVLHGLSRGLVAVARWDRWFDESFVDGFVNGIGRTMLSVGESLRGLQTGQVRQYVMWIAVGVVMLFAALFTALPK